MAFFVGCCHLFWLDWGRDAFLFGCKKVGAAGKGVLAARRPLPVHL